jgi:SagB-type dehydrogenase family enzyme
MKTTRDEDPVRRTELDATSLPELRDRVRAFDASPLPVELRSYPGVPRVALERVRARPFASLDKALLGRRSVRRLGTELPGKRTLSRLLWLGHGATASQGRGPAPSAGGLQAVELYVVVLESGWLEHGAYHYDRAGHHLARLAPAERAEWERLVPSLAQNEGGALLFVLAGDAARVEPKYGERTGRFLLIEAGHVVQNLCLLSTSLGLATVPLGGVLEQEVARALFLPRTDLVLYAAVAGPPA